MSWIVVASRTGARIFNLKPNGRMNLLEDLANPDGRGHLKDRASLFRREKTLQERNAERFAKTLALHLEKHAMAGSFDHVVIAASPRLLGLLRKQCGDVLGPRAEWIAKDLAMVAAADVPKFLGL